MNSKTKLYPITVAMLCSSLLLGCGNDSENESTSSTSTSNKVSVNAIERVPADSAYVFANSEGIPEGVFDDMLKQFNGSSSGMQEYFELLSQTDLESDIDSEQLDNMFSYAQRYYELIADVTSLKEFSQKTGLGYDSQFVIYANHLFPVLINPVANADTLNSTINELLGEQASNVTQVTVDGVSVNQILFAEDKIGAFWSVNDEQVTAAILPLGTEQDFLASTFGSERPANAFNMSTLEALNDEYDFLPYGSGFVDFIKVFRELSQTGMPLADLITQHGDDPDLQAFVSNPACIAETQQLINKMPRMNVGYTELDKGKMTTRLAWELEPEFQNGLAKIVGDAPINANSESVYNMGLSLNISGLLDFLGEQTASTLATPFNCEALESLNATAATINEAIDRPMPPFIGNVQGFQVSLTDLDFIDGATIPDIAGNLVLFSKSPSLLIGLGQLALPFLAELDLEPGAEPQQVESGFIPAELGSVYLATSEQAIGVALGDAQVSNLSNLLTPEDSGDQYLMTFGMDYSAYGKLIESLDLDLDGLEEYDEHGEPISDEEKADIENAKKLLESSQKLYDSLGYTYGSVRINDKALITDQTITYQ